MAHWKIVANFFQKNKSVPDYPLQNYGLVRKPTKKCKTSENLFIYLVLRGQLFQLGNGKLEAGIEVGGAAQVEQGGQRVGAGLLVLLQRRHVHLPPVLEQDHLNNNVEVRGRKGLGPEFVL